MQLGGNVRVLYVAVIEHAPVKWCGQKLPRIYANLSPDIRYKGACRVKIKTIVVLFPRSSDLGIVFRSVDQGRPEQVFLRNQDAPRFKEPAACISNRRDVLLEPGKDTA